MKLKQWIKRIFKGWKITIPSKTPQGTKLNKKKPRIKFTKKF